MKTSGAWRTMATRYREIAAVCDLFADNIDRGAATELPPGLTAFFDQFDSQSRDKLVQLRQQLEAAG